MSVWTFRFSQCCTRPFLQGAFCRGCDGGERLSMCAGGYLQHRNELVDSIYVETLWGYQGIMWGQDIN